MKAKNIEVIALRPYDIPAAQKHLSSWCEAKIAEIKTEVANLNESIAVARRTKMRTSNLIAHKNMTERRITFYEKVKMAIDEGYVIVPNFPINVFAIRTKAQYVQRFESAYHASDRDQKAQMLPTGHGRYVSPQPIQGERQSGGEKPKTLYFADDFDDVLLPVVAVKPTILKATEVAIVKKMFDQIGMVGSPRARDPMIVGQLIDPRSSRYNLRVITFFIAWWIDTSDL